MADFESPQPPEDSVENDEETPEVKEIPAGKRFYRINNRGELEFLDSPYEVPEVDRNAEK